MNEIQETIERFLTGSAQPALCELGAETLSIGAHNFVVEERGGVLTIQAWDDHRSLSRRVVGIESEVRGRLVLRVEHFGKRSGTVALVDLRHPSGSTLAARSSHLEFREVLRRFLRRQYPRFRIAELSAAPDLEHSLSPVYPRALLREGASAWAAIAAPPEPMQTDGVLSFGLIWLDYLREREPDLAVRGLILFLPAGAEKNTCLRLLFLNPCLAQYTAFVYDKEALEYPVDLRDYGNLDTRLEPCRRAAQRMPHPAVDRLARIDGVESIDRPDGELSLRVKGLEFARTVGADLLFGLETRRKLTPSNESRLERLARELARVRCADTEDRLHPLYMRNPEAWLESETRAQLEQIDATLLPGPVYGQVPAFAASDRGVMDLLAVDRDGRLAVIELKASEDIHLPLQGLDYWMRVKWHLERGEFTSHGYFPGQALRTEPPRILLVSPALEIHPTNERVIRYISPAAPIERIGVGLEWQKRLKVMYRA